MRRPRVFLSAAAAPGETVLLPAHARRHLATVLRFEVGDRLEGVAPGGVLLELEWLSAGRARVIGACPAGVPGGPMIAGDTAGAAAAAPEPAAAVTLALAMPVGARADWVVEKAAEIGAGAVVPLLAARSARGPAGAQRTERWRRLARAAAEQSRRLRVPEVLPPAELGALVRDFGGPCLLPHPGAPLGLRAAAALRCAGAPRVMIAVGPEGGWTQAELGDAQALGACPCSLGPRILRVETAALVALALVLDALGALGPSGG